MLDDEKNGTKTETRDKAKEDGEERALVASDKAAMEADVAKAFKNMPEPMRGFFMAMSRTTSQGSPFHPLIEKFTPEHTSKFLDNVRKEDEDEYRLKSSGRWFQIIYLTLALAFLAFLIAYLLPKDKDLLTKIVELLIVFGGGFGAGYGIKSKKE